ncbi:MAG: hypothetical protein ACLFTI_12685 [Anaerolineales bacterium]
MNHYRRMQELLAALMARNRAPDFPADLAILADPAASAGRWRSPRWPWR